VLRIIEEGYRLPFEYGNLPACAIFKNNRSAFDHSEFVEREIDVLLSHGSIVEVQSPPTVVNPLTVSVAASGKHRLVLDAGRYLNCHLRIEKFKFEDLRTLLPYLSQSGYLISFDLTSCYHHVDVWAPHQTFLGFSWCYGDHVRYFQFTVLAFGLSPAGFCASKVLRPLVRRWRESGILVVTYLDDGIVTASSFEECHRASVIVRTELFNAGWVVNQSKSDWNPSHERIFLGFHVDLRDFKLKVPIEKQVSILDFLTLCIDKRVVSARSLSRVAGKLTALWPAVGKLARLMTKCLHSQIAVASSFDARLVPSPESIAEMHFWKTFLPQHKGLPIRNFGRTESVVFTDASATAGGAIMRVGQGSYVCHLPFSMAERQQSSTWRELKAVEYALRSFGSSFLYGKRVSLRTDNRGVVSIVDYGSMVGELHSLSLSIFSLCLLHSIELEVVWVPREENVVADEVSRYCDWDDWGISVECFDRLSALFGKHSLDCFANSQNTKCEAFFSRWWAPGTSGVNAFAFSWANQRCWLCSPVHLVIRAIHHLADCASTATLVVPHWTGAAFWPILFGERPSFGWLVKRWRVIKAGRFCLVPGSQQTSIFHPDRFVGNLLAIDLDARHRFVLS